MANVTITTRIQLRNDTAANWTSRNPVLLKGEVGLENDTGRLKWGDGSTAWTSLEYAAGGTPEVQSRAPTGSDTGYLVGQMWFNTADSNKLYILVASSPVTWLAFPTFDDLSGFGAGDMLEANYDSNSDNIVNQADKVTNTITITVGGGSTEGTNKFTFDGSAAKAINLAAGANISFNTGTPGTVSIAAAHPTISTNTDTTSSASPAHGGTFDVVDGVTRDGNGHVTKINTKTVTLPADNNTVTSVGVTSVAGEVTVNGTPATGTVKLGDAASKIVSTSIPASPTADQQATLPNLAAVKAYADALIGANDAMVYKGVIAGGAVGAYGALTPAANAGDTYKVSAAGKINGVSVEIGDMLICTVDSTAAADSGTYGTVVSNWNFIQLNIDGSVIGPAGGVTDGHVVAFDGTSGHQVKTTSLLYTDLLNKNDTFILDGGSSL